MRIAVGSRPDWPASLLAAKSVSDKLRKAGHEPIPLALDSRVLTKELERAEIAFVFGGDGTVLRAARVLSPKTSRHNRKTVGYSGGCVSCSIALGIRQIDFAKASRVGAIGCSMMTSRGRLSSTAPRPQESCSETSSSGATLWRSRA